MAAAGQAYGMAPVLNLCATVELIPEYLQPKLDLDPFSRSHSKADNSLCQTDRQTTLQSC